MIMSNGMNKFEQEVLALLDKNLVENAIPLSDEFFTRIEALKQKAEQLQELKSNQGN
jgi:hypothetical protein